MRHATALALAAAVVLTAPAARAITYGTPDCVGSVCAHPNAVSVSGFRQTATGLVSSVRCSGSLLDDDGTSITILTAAHCTAAWMDGLQSGALVDIGVSFDPVIARLGPTTTLWSADQYILGGQPVQPPEFGPHGLNAFNVQFDYAVVVFTGGPAWQTDAGQPVTIPAPITLPPLNYLRGIVTPGGPNPLLTAVGYGNGEALNPPGAGGNAGGAVNDSSKLGVRWQTPDNLAFSFSGKNANLLTGSQNPARGFAGTCGGDSGGPMFYKPSPTVEYQVGITSSGDSICRASSIIARTEAPEAATFIGCAKSGTGLPSIAACGCTSVDRKGLCATP